jgi:hypothetical protein
MGLGRVDGLAGIRNVVQRSFPVERRTPNGDPRLLADAMQRFKRITAAKA